MTYKMGVIVVQEDTPSGNVYTYANRENYIWLKTSTGELFDYKPESDKWVLVGITCKPHEHPQSEIIELVNTLSQKAGVEHTHTELGDINFTGTISVDGNTGITGSKVVGGFRITFRKGLLVGFEPV